MAKAPSLLYLLCLYYMGTIMCCNISSIKKEKCSRRSCRLARTNYLLLPSISPSALSPRSLSVIERKRSPTLGVPWGLGSVEVVGHGGGDDPGDHGGGRRCRRGRHHLQPAGQGAASHHFRRAQGEVRRGHGPRRRQGHRDHRCRRQILRRF